MADITDRKRRTVGAGIAMSEIRAADIEIVKRNL